MSERYLTEFPANDYRSYLAHSAKGQTWKQHKYIAIRNGRYIYPKDNKHVSGRIRYGRGNIDLYDRPVYVNDDGSHSTVESFSVNIKGKEVLLPAIARDRKGRPVRLSQRQAINRYLKTGKHLGKFDTPEEATRYAISLHNQQDALYRNSRERYSFANSKRLSDRKRVLGKVMRTRLR